MDDWHGLDQDGLPVPLSFTTHWTYFCFLFFFPPDYKPLTILSLEHLL